jgi:hypothetical protein
MPVPLIDLLESAFDDDPAARPADGSVLAQRIQQSLPNR